MLSCIDHAVLSTIESSLCPAVRNHAVAHCASVRESVHKQLIANGATAFVAKVQANKAFRSALPPLIGRDNICDYIACVGYGIATGAIDEDSGRLLYAAQVALSTLPKEPKSAPKPPA